MDRSAEISEMFFTAQEEIVTSLQDGESKRFAGSGWEREGFGHGLTHLVEYGEVLERAAVNVSLVRGDHAPPAITEGHSRLDREGLPFRATGLSMIVHPRNPYAPSFHANFRYFEVGDQEWWFGGGLDLTPVYPFPEDCRHFHHTLKSWACRHAHGDYDSWKPACDRYFYLPHRQEMRGVGGVFFDHLTLPGEAPDELLPLIREGLATIVPAYLPLVHRRAGTPYGQRERDWQMARRTRYVEFNLIYDRGTQFGLQAGVNVDSVLMSMPPAVGWSIEHIPPADSVEGRVAEFLRPHDWAGETTPTLVTTA